MLLPSGRQTDSIRFTSQGAAGDNPADRGQSQFDIFLFLSELHMSSVWLFNHFGEYTECDLTVSF